MRISCVIANTALLRGEKNRHNKQAIAIANFAEL